MVPTGQIKNLLALIAVLLTFAGYVPYVRDILNGKTKPHIYSWLLWSLVTGIAFAIQFAGRAGLGAFVTLAAAVMCSVVFFLSFFSKGKRDITVVDTVFLILALIALVIWLLAKQPVISIVLTTLIDVLGFAPTVRKSWNRPWTETISFYYLNSFRFALASLSLQEYTVITALYPVTWFFINSLFAAVLVFRRKKIPKR